MNFEIFVINFLRFSRVSSAVVAAAEPQFAHWLIFVVHSLFSANLISFSHGCIIGWVTPALMLLTSDETPLSSGPITLEELSWIGSMNSIGAMLGTFSFGCFTTLIGCKRAMTFLALPAIGYWVTIVYGDSANWIIFARFLAGWCGGGILSISVLYVAEIADPK